MGSRGTNGPQASTRPPIGVAAGRGLGRDELRSYLDECRDLVVDELFRCIPRDSRVRGVLYERMLDYPLRPAKALRPSLCIASCRALGGPLREVLPTAAVLELFHNAFLIHDDIEDGSLKRRGEATLHEKFGLPIAINVADGMFALALEPLLDNCRHLGVGPALRILQVVARMTRETAEGQAMELEWIRDVRGRVRPDDYLRMVHKKSSWYTFVAPMLVGAVAAGAPRELEPRLGTVAALTGIAFQIQDDLLNLVGAEDAVGKEAMGDLWEGKRTLMLIHALDACTEDERRRCDEILAKPRPGLEREASEPGDPRGGAHKTAADVAYLFELMERYGSLEVAGRVARRHAAAALRRWGAVAGTLPDTVHARFLGSVIEYVVTRAR